MVRYLFYTIGDLTYQSPLVGNSCHYQLNWKADGSQGQLGHCGEANNLVLLQTVQ